MNRRLVFAIMMLASLRAWAQRDASQMRLQVLNGRTGKPVVHARVTVWASDDIPKHPAKKLVKAETDGEGYISLPDAGPVPQHVIVDIETFRPCSRTDTNSFTVQKIAATGLVSENACKPRISLYPQAGTLVFFVRPETWLERLRK